MKISLKTYTKALLIGCLSLSTVSCSQFLDKQALGEETAAVYFNSQDKAIHSVTAAYSDLKDYRLGWAQWAFGETLSDDATYSGSDSDLSGFQLLKEFNGTADMSLPRLGWQLCYRGISKSSESIEGIQNMSDDLFTTPGLKKRLIAEATFLRAYYHWNLALMYGSVPIVDHAIKTAKEKISPSPVDSVYAFIATQLEQAEPNLPLKSEYAASDLGRVTKGAADALLAKVNLYRKNWSEAAKWSKKVIDSGEYQLDPDYAHQFTFDGENGMESIFEIQFFDSPTESSAYYNNGNFQTLFQLPRGITYGYGINQPTKSLYNAFMAENDTVRELGTLMDTTAVFHSELADEYAALAAAEQSGDQSAIDNANAALADGKSKLLDDRTGYYNRKIYVGPADRAVNIRNNGNNIRVLRYSDVLLMYAEAEFHLGSESEALTYMNKVRERVNLPDKNVSGDALLQAIYTERHLELAMENDRYPDLVRTGRASILPGWTQAHQYWPVPQAEVDITSGVVPQNPGYEAQAN